VPPGTVPGPPPPTVHLACKVADEFTASTYNVRICGMPGYDQRRIPMAGLGAAGHTIIGMPFADGDCHCVPTSLMNILGYYGAKGLKVTAATRARSTTTTGAS
jgi:hypothetical protein